jgi:hypothetical protein
MEWMHKSLSRAGLGIVLATSLTLFGCDPEIIGNGGGDTADSLVALAKIDMGNAQFAKALTKCRKAVELEANHVEANYCIVTANLGAMVSTVSNIINLISSQTAPAINPLVDGKSLLGSVLTEIEEQMAEIDRHAFILVGMNDPLFKIAKLPLALDISSIMDLAGVDFTGNETIDLKGTWDSTQLHLIGGAFNSVQAILDYLFAHNLTIDKLAAPKFTAEGLAIFMYDNPKLLHLDADTDSLDRMAGTGKWKGPKLGFLSALSYLVGRDAALERVAPANDGLVGAIKASATSNDSSRIIIWTDADGNGIPEKIAVPAIGEMNASITIDGETTEVDSEVENSISVALWLELIQLGKDIRDNIEGSGAAPYQVKPIVTSIFDEIAGSDSAVEGLAETFEVTEQEVRDFLAVELPDLIYVNPGEFLAAPSGIRDLFPYYFEYTIGEVTKKSLAFEVEHYRDGVTAAIEKRGQIFETATDDHDHFVYPEDGVTFAFTHFPGLVMGDLKVFADGIATSETFKKAYYVRLQDSSLGGLLHLNLSSLNLEDGTDPVGDPEGVAKPNAYGFNRGLNGLIRHYEVALE